MRVFNFSAGPATLPLDVLEEVRDELVDYRGTGMSIIESSHRSGSYEAIHQSAIRLLRELFEVPDEFDVLLIQGGATMQFGMVPMNLLTGGLLGGYVETGAWASKAFADGAHHGAVYAAWNGRKAGYCRVPVSEEVAIREGTRYLHVTSNETIEGLQFHDWPVVSVALVADMSSDLLSRTIPWQRFDLVYGGVQKNLGPAGLTLVFVRRSILERTDRDLAPYFRYDVHANENSLYNTPPVFSVYVMEKVLRWMGERGGVPAMAAAARRRADLIYRTIDESDGFFVNTIEAGSRSLMNAVFGFADPDHEAEFLSGATARGLEGLRGHRSVGGCRASIYNAMPQVGVEALCEFMTDFRERVG